MMTFDDLAQNLLSFASRSLGAGASPEEIASASDVLGVPIVGGYREFLRRFGHGGVADMELYGLGSGVPRYLNLINMTESERTEMEPAIPHHLLPIWNNGSGDHACLDTSAGPTEPPVVMWYHEDGRDQVPDVVAPDFVSWLARLVATREVS